MEHQSKAVARGKLRAQQQGWKESTKYLLVRRRNINLKLISFKAMFIKERSPTPPTVTNTFSLAQSWLLLCQCFSWETWFLIQMLDEAGHRTGNGCPFLPQKKRQNFVPLARRSSKQS